MFYLLQDESDEMLSRGFKDQIYDVYRYLPPELQVIYISLFFTLLFSSLLQWCGTSSQAQYNSL